MQQLLRSVLGGFQVEEFLVLVDELGVHGGVQELVVAENILEERDVGLEMKMEKSGKLGVTKRDNVHGVNSGRKRSLSASPVLQMDL